MAYAEQSRSGHGYYLMADEEVVLYAKSGSQLAMDHLLGKYRNLVEGKAKAYFLVGAEHDDVVQEGMIGLFKAIRDFSSDHLSAFRSFAEVCITRQIITAVKTAMRQKHWLLNTCVPIDAPLLVDEGLRTLEDVLVELRPCNPEELLLSCELQDEIFRHIKQGLSQLESNVLSLYFEGRSYEEIGAQLGCNVKQVDNALQRAKKKMARKLRMRLAPAIDAGADVAQG